MEKLNLYELSQTRNVFSLSIFGGEIELKVHKISIAQVDGLLNKLSKFLEKINFEDYKDLSFLEAIKKALKDPSLFNDVLDMVFISLNHTSASMVKDGKSYALFSREDFSVFDLEDIVSILEFLWETNFAPLLKKMRKQTQLTTPE